MKNQMTSKKALDMIEEYRKLVTSEEVSSKELKEAVNILCDLVVMAVDAITAFQIKYEPIESDVKDVKSLVN